MKQSRHDSHGMIFESLALELADYLSGVENPFANLL